METKSIKSNYTPPLIIKVGELEIEHLILAGSIVPDGQEVDIEKQNFGKDLNFESEGWESGGWG